MLKSEVKKPQITSENTSILNFYNYTNYKQENFCVGNKKEH